MADKPEPVVREWEFDGEFVWRAGDELFNDGSVLTAEHNDLCRAFLQLRAEGEALRAKVVDLERGFANATADAEGALRQMAEEQIAREASEASRAGLVKYARHDETCDRYKTIETDRLCNCGLDKIKAALAPPAQDASEKETLVSTKENPMTEAQIKHMVDRFLNWKLPANFNPDGGIHFDAEAAWRLNPKNRRYEPSGTNLFDATQAGAMVRHMLEGLP